MCSHNLLSPRVYVLHAYAWEMFVRGNVPNQESKCLVAYYGMRLKKKQGTERNRDVLLIDMYHGVEKL